jgi:uncharacterized membrane protein YdbT with pleckstrin-like domain
MSYIQHSLSDSEALLYKARFPWFYYASAWGALILLGVCGVIASAKIETLLVVPLFALGLALFLGAMVPIWTTEIGVTNQRLIYKRGLLWRNTQELQLRAIEEVKLTQGLLGRLFNFGRLELHGTGVGDIALPSLADPVGLRKALQDGMTAAAQQAAAGAAPRVERAPQDPSRSAA